MTRRDAGTNIPDILISGFFFCNYLVGDRFTYPALKRDDILWYLHTLWFQWGMNLIEWKEKVTPFQADHSFGDIPPGG